VYQCARLTYGTLRYAHLDKILTRSGPFADEGFTPGAETQSFLREQCKILVIGA
jgi:ubiquitin-activating enzyme E1 C